jgi:exosortase/archaeosortase family protein
MVPFGAFVTPWLQHFTARFIVAGLGVLDIPYVADNNVIEIPEGTFFVAEACAGLRFLIAAVAFGVLYACLIYRSPAKRTIFVAVSIIVPIIANGLRGLGIVVLGHVLGSAEAAATDHVVYGWVFFSIVILLLVAAGLPFREDGTPYRPVLGPSAPPPSRPIVSRIVAAAAMAIVLTAIGPASAGLLERAANSEEMTVDPQFALAPGCTELAPPPLAHGDVVTTVSHRFECGETILTVTTTTLPPRANPGAVLAAMRRRSGELDAEDATSGVLHVPGLTPGAWPMVQTDKPTRLTAMVLWADGMPARGGMAFRLAQAWRGIAGAAHAPVIVAVSIDPGEEHLAAARLQALRHSIVTFLAAQTNLGAQIAALSAARGGP